jgi:hypothetical protein
MENIMLSTPSQRIVFIAKNFANGKIPELAKRLNMKYEVLYPYSKGTRKPGTVVLERFSRLGFSPDWILYGRGSMHIADQTPDDSTPIVRKISEEGNFERLEIIVPKGFSVMLTPKL